MVVLYVYKKGSKTVFTALKKLWMDQESRRLVRRVLKEHVWCYRKKFGLALVFMVFAAVSTSALPYLLQPVFDDVFHSGSLTLLASFCLAVFIAFVVKGISSYGESVTMTYIGQRIVTDIQARLFSHLLKSDLDFFHKNNSGQLVSCFTNDINLMRTSVANTVVGLGKDTITFFLLLGVMFYQDWLLAVVAFFVFPVAILPIAKIGRRMKKVTLDTQGELASLTTLLTQVFQGVRVVKSYTMEAYEQNRIQELIERIFSLNYKATRTRSAAHPIVESMAGIAIVLVIAYGGWQVMHETRTTGEFISFIAALLLVYEPLKRLSNLNTTIQEGVAAAARVFALMDQHPSIKSPDESLSNPLKDAALQGEITFENVSFSYKNGKTALSSITLNIKPGQTIAFVGPSGAGKSSLINLLPRFYDCTSGRILLDNRALTSFDLEALRYQIALVSQEIMLFDDTVFNNIAYGKKNATKDEITRAAKLAAAHEFIENLSHGYETVVGENGVKLSGGQRQRIAIARAMLKNAPILLLDEATSALDTESEKTVQEALYELMKNRTTLVVAHRLSTIVDADVICVLQEGKIIEMGRHEDLMEKGGLYSILWKAQSER